MKNKTALTIQVVVIVVLLGAVVYGALANAQLFQSRKANTAQNVAVTNIATNNTSMTNTANTSNNTSTSNITNTTGNITGTSSNTATNTTNTTGSDTTTTPATGKPTVVNATPANGANATAAVSEVSVTFDRTLDASSTLSVTKKILPSHVGTGNTVFSSDKKTMSLAINGSSSDTYTIHYTACTGANVDCSIGTLTFTISGVGVRNPEKSSTY